MADNKTEQPAAPVRGDHRRRFHAGVFPEVLWQILLPDHPVELLHKQNQIQAMRDACEEALYKAGLKTKQIEGNSSSTWILMDYGDIIVHIFSKEDRLFYDLERIWRDGKIVDVADL